MEYDRKKHRFFVPAFENQQQILVRNMFYKTTFIFVLSLASVVQTHASISKSDSLFDMEESGEASLLTPLRPAYLSSVTLGGDWRSNWFLNIQGGTSAFVGSPLGCADLFDRTRPVIQVNVGKWFTPAIGGRIAWQGMEFKDCQLETRKYRYVHADFLYNLTHDFSLNDQGLSRWDVIPFVGVGMIHNKDFQSNGNYGKMCGDTHPFAFSYGIQGRCRMTNSLYLTAEFSGMTTFRSFDAAGASNRFGDNMLNLSAGLSLTLGKPGWKRVIDARPYINQNDRLMEYCNRLKDRHVEDVRIIAEYHKILEIEGLLDIYGDSVGQKGMIASKRLFPKNNYSGLNSLRARMNDKGLNGRSENTQNSMKKSGDNQDERTENAIDGYKHDCLVSMNDSNGCIGAPVYFFFKIGTDELTEPSQLLNIVGIAGIAVKYGLKMKISGAADSATGTEAINCELSTRRAEFIKRLMIERGVDSRNITIHPIGGIDSFSPVTANRNSCVILTF